MNQIASVHSACLAGLDVAPVTIDVDISPGLPQISLVGVAGAGAYEATSRVRCAIRASGFEIPQQRIVVQISPSITRPRGTSLDLAIAVAILAATRQISVPLGAVFIGELSLDGRVMSTRGLACYSDWCAEHDTVLVCPQSNEHISHVPLDALADLRALDWNHRISSRLEPASTQPQELPEAARAAFCSCLGTNRVLLLRGEDGPVSRSVIACRRSLPQLAQEQCNELARIHSACSVSFEGEPPFRAPHHSITCAGLISGGRPVIPGEVTLATHGLLLISDVERWSQTQLQALSTALADGVSRIVRAEGIWVMPAAPALIIATTTDTRTPADQLLRSLAQLGFEEASL